LLNHPNIAAIYGFEASDGVKALVLELVDGPTLADRIAQRPIPLDEALRMAKQIAEALEGGLAQRSAPRLPAIPQRDGGRPALGPMVNPDR
jgi:serine/threonine protein kinase